MTAKESEAFMRALDTYIRMMVGDLAHLPMADPASALDDARKALKLQLQRAIKTPRVSRP